MSSSEVAVSIRELSKAYVIAHRTGEVRDVRRCGDGANSPSVQEGRAGNVLGVARCFVRRDAGRSGRNHWAKWRGQEYVAEDFVAHHGADGWRVELFGRVGSLLEVGTGFHPELTGRENIFLNGAVLGMTRGEIRRQFEAIVDFAEVEKFLDTPVKRYSSGMYVRLAFAVAAHLNPEILVVDEVLAVGDAEFQRKCMGKMNEVAKGGRTVVFVSHNMAAVEALCNRCVLLREGQKFFPGGSRSCDRAVWPIGRGGQRDYRVDGEVLPSESGDRGN